MLESKKLELRRSEIRQELATLAARPDPSEDEVRSMESLDKEYRTAEIRYRAALVAEDEERREAGGELETRDSKEWADMLGRFELRQVAAALDHGHQIDGETAEIVTELRSQGAYQGIPVPWQALERRAGETVAGGTTTPTQTRPIIDRLFPGSVAARMGGQMINVAQGQIEYPVATSGAAVGWQATETGAVGGPSAYATTDKPLAPDNTLGVQMRVTRKALKQSGDALEQAVRRDMNGAMSQEVDRAAFLGAGASGEPLGVIAGAATYGITETTVDAAPSWSAIRAAVVRFMTANAASSPDAVRMMIRPEVWSDLDDALITGTAVSEWDRLTRNIPAGNIAMSTNGLAAPAGVTPATKALLTTTAGGVSPFFVATWGAVDLIRDPYTDAASGGLRLTALATMDITVARAVQLEVLTGLQ